MEVMKMKPHEWASYPGDLVMASTFDAAMKVKDAEIERLKCKLRVDSYEADVQNARADHMQKRAEAAEAEVAALAALTKPSAEVVE